MKTFKILFLLISLSIPTTSYACWDDYDDDWGTWDPWNEDDDDDGSYDYDAWTDAGWDGYGSDGGNDTGDDYDDVGDDYYGYGVVITPDDNDDDWYDLPDQDDDYSDDGDDYEDYNDDDTNISGDSHTTIGSNYSSQEYILKNTDKLIIFDKMKKWNKQSEKMSCVVTAMEYASQILKDNDLNYRIVFTDDYKYHIYYDNDFNSHGVRLDELEPFIRLEFDAKQIYSQYSFIESIENGWPILSVISSTALYSWSPVEHLVVIIGQTGDGNSYIYIDPDNGGYKTINYYSILGPNFSVKSLKRY